jgi:hypothetical protein
MPEYSDLLKQYGGRVGTAFIQWAAPGIASGFINQLFHQWHVDVGKITECVQNNRSLWDEIGLDDREQISNLAKKVGNVDFISAEFLIKSIRKDFPAVASLFLNWPEAAEWLIKQIAKLKAGVNGLDQ